MSEDSDEQARATAANDQWVANLPQTTDQARAFHDALVKSGFTEDHAATITGHWLAASITTSAMQGPMVQMVERFMAITDPEGDS